MGVDIRRPPLPAPTEDPSSMEEADMATDLSRRTDHTSISIPEDGSPITIPTSHLHPPKGGILTSRRGSQTSLLIEYFEGSKKGDKSRSKPSVRVKVTPSSARRSKGVGEAVQITGIGKDRKPSYTRRISLGNKAEAGEKVVIDGTEVSRSTDSNASGRPPVEIEVLNGSEVSGASRDLRYLEHTSDISSMPPDSILENAPGTVDPETITEDNAVPLHRKRSRSLERAVDTEVTQHLDAPSASRTRSLSRDRITRKVMEKLAGKSIDRSSRHAHGVEYEPGSKPGKERRRRSSRSHYQDDGVSPGSSQLSALTASQNSYRSGGSKVSINNPRLLEMVEDTVRRVIIPELQQMRNEQKVGKNLQDFESGRRPHAVETESYSTDIERTISKSSSTPNIRGKPKVVLNRYDDEPGQVLSRGDSERRKERRSSRGSVETPERRHRRSSRSYSIDEEREPEKKEKKTHRARDAAAGALAGGILTAAALKHHNSKEEDRKERRRRHGGRDSRSESITESTERTYDPTITDPSYDQNLSEQVDEHGAPLGHDRRRRRHHDRLHDLRHEDQTQSFNTESETPLREDGPGGAAFRTNTSTDTFESAPIGVGRHHGHDGHEYGASRDTFESAPLGVDAGRTHDVSVSEDSIERTPRGLHHRREHDNHARTYIPFATGPTDSEITRESLLSEATERPESMDYENLATPVKEVKRGSYGEIRSGTNTASTRTPVPHTRPHGDVSESSFDETMHASPGTVERAHSKSRNPLLMGAAAGLGGAVAGYALGKNKAGKQKETDSLHETISPVQSVSSYRNDLNDPLIPQALQSRSPVSTFTEKNRFSGYTNSPLSSPGVGPLGGRVSPLAPDVDSFASRAKRSSQQAYSEGSREAGSRPATTEDWLEEEHQTNERHRDSIARDSLRDSYDGNDRGTIYTEDSVRSSELSQSNIENQTGGLRGNPEYVHHPIGLESAVASLVDPSMISSSQQSSAFGAAEPVSTKSVDALGIATHEPRRAHESNNFNGRVIDMGDTAPATYETEGNPEEHGFNGRVIDMRGSSPAAHEREAAPELAPSPAHGMRSNTPISQRIPRKAVAASPIQNDTDFENRNVSPPLPTPVHLSASGVPDFHDPGPEIGYGLESQSSRNSLASVPRSRKDLVEERHTLEGSGRSPRGSARDFSFERNDAQSIQSKRSGRGEQMMAAGVGLAAGAAAAHAFDTHHKSRTSSAKSLPHQASFNDEYDEAEQESPQTRRSRSPLVPGNPRQTSVHDEYEEEVSKLRPAPLRSPPKPTITPTNAPISNDEGYVSGAYARSLDTPAGNVGAGKEYSREDLAEYDAAMRDEEPLEYTPTSVNEDPFMNAKRQKHLSANSQGLESPLFDGATGHGMDRIQSKDIVALMDHLTVRDGQRNARDTEILVTLVRSAAEMRQQFEEMKKYIAEQDRMMMKHTDKDADMTVKKVLAGQKQYPREHIYAKANLNNESIASKRPNVFRRALKGLSGSSPGELSKFENMLNQILDDVEYLKEAQMMQDRQPSTQGSDPSFQESRKDGFTSYEALRANADSGYDPEGLPGTGSTPNQSGTLQLSPPPKTGFHSGYDGRRDSINRVSTVLEGDEEEFDIDREEQLTPKPSAAQQAAAMGNLDSRRNGMMFGTPPGTAMNSAEQTPQQTPERHRKNKSSSSSNFIPKVSRWSKTTASSTGDGFDSRRQSREQRPVSDASLGGRSATHGYYYDDASNGSHSRSGSQGSLPRSAAHSDGLSMRSRDSGRAASPLIPSEASASRERLETSHRQSRSLSPEDEGEYMEDFKFVPVRDSLLLQHPQPVAGDGKRRGAHLESEAQSFQHLSPSIPGTESSLSVKSVDSEFDPSQWGSNPALSLARAQRLGKINPPTRSPVQSVSPADSTPRQAPRRRAEDELPIQRPGGSPEQDDSLSGSGSSEDDDDDDRGDMFANLRRDTSRGQGRKYERSAAPPRSFERHYYSSPLGNGHLLEPIEEVRYSLETDGGRTPTPRAALGGSMGRASGGASTGRRGTDGSVSPGPEASPGREGKLSRLEGVRKITGPRPMSGRVGSGGLRGKIFGSSS